MELARESQFLRGQRDRGSPFAGRHFLRLEVEIAQVGVDVMAQFVVEPCQRIAVRHAQIAFGGIMIEEKFENVLKMLM